jgi:hypothetical protein
MIKQTTLYSIMIPLPYHNKPPAWYINNTIVNPPGRQPGLDIYILYHKHGITIYHYIKNHHYTIDKILS